MSDSAILRSLRGSRLSFRTADKPGHAQRNQGCYELRAIFAFEPARLGGSLGGRSWLILQRGSAVPAVHVISTDHTLTARAVCAYSVAAARAGAGFRRNRVPSQRESAWQPLPQDEVEKDAQPIGNEKRHQRPKNGAHPAPPCVAANISDEQQITTEDDAKHATETHSRPCRLPSHHDIEENLCADESECRQSVGPRRNNLDFRRESSLSFIIPLHRIAPFPNSIAFLSCYPNGCREPRGPHLRPEKVRPRRT